MRPDVVTLAALGPHAETGGRFFGVTNLIETMVLVAILPVAARARPGVAIAVCGLAIVLVGWSRAGADGGGLLVLAAGLLVAGLLRCDRGRGCRPGASSPLPRRPLPCLCCSLRSIALVGGSSHVTRTLDEGPGGLGTDLRRRLELSLEAATHNPHTIAICVVALVTLLVVAVRVRPLPPSATALLVGLGVSLLVNDSPPDVLVTGAIGAVAMDVEHRWASRGRADPSPHSHVDQ